MTMFVLIVEDEEAFIEEILEVLTSLPGNTEVKIARSRDGAFSFLDSDFFDLVILDLKIPTIDGALDADPRHGHAVFGKARSAAPGTPIFVLTGSPAEDFIPDLLKHQQQLDIWSEGRKVGTVDFLQKYRFDECPSKLLPIASAIEGLSEVELDGGGLDLTIADDRLIRIFARKFGGRRCVVSRLGGGLSGAKVVRLRVTNRDGVCVHDAVAKLGSQEDVRDEGLRFDTLVVRLDPGATPRKLAMLEFGAHTQAGIFYGLADGFEESAFDIAVRSPERSAAIISSVEGATRRWIDGVPQTRRPIKEVRQRVLSDESLADILRDCSIDWVPDFENREIQTRWACIHGDLHGCNILVSAEGAAVLIDYGDVGDGPASLDPATLELSLLFHPDRPLVGQSWPSHEQAAQWGDLDQYLVNCPATEFIRECRGWAMRAAAGNREVAASAYSYLLRQLTYDDTDKPLAIALLDGVISYYEAT